MDPLLAVVLAFGLMFVVRVSLGNGLAQAPHPLVTQGSLARIEVTCNSVRSRSSDPSSKSRRTYASYAEGIRQADDLHDGNGG